MKSATLEECIQTALQNNRRRPAPRYAVKMAEAFGIIQTPAGARLKRVTMERVTDFVQLQEVLLQIMTRTQKKARLK